MIFNQSTGIVSVKSSGANSLIGLSQNTCVTCTCIDTAGGTGTASWSISAVKSTESNIVYVSKSGSSANNGLSPSSPMLTFQSAANIANARTPSATNRFAIVCLDDGVYTSGVNLNSFVDLYAPNATISLTSFSSYCITAGDDTYVTIKKLMQSGGASAYVYTSLATATETAWLWCQCIKVGETATGAGAIDVEGASTLFAYVGSIDDSFSVGDGDAIFLNDAAAFVRLTVGSIDTGNVISNNTSIIGAYINAAYCKNAVNRSIGNAILMAPNLFGAWTPTILGSSTPGTTTYVARTGTYTIIGNTVVVDASIEISAATGTGDVVIGGLPQPIGTGNYATGGLVFDGSGWTWPTGTTNLSLLGNDASTLKVVGSGSAVASANMAMTNAALTIKFSSTYQLQ